MQIKTIFEMHEKLEKYMCSDCTEDFSTETSFKVHFKQYHDSVIITEDPTILNLGYFHETVDKDISFKRKLKTFYFLLNLQKPLLVMLPVKIPIKMVFCQRKWK